ncbi:hypothetical protein M422DRAFT_72584 [Sphaerobolus stellatus SS14]|uniref:Uncharacterized protein n=1 Tax=Sphaerobolus stellatus (strain SS14) TaxID=990650 RepID=A0A0C9TN64_SPHS4|nr:hypothetical protein M422DRAFT_72584 [Sphaerobolus stellatus SS14]
MASGGPLGPEFPTSILQGALATLISICLSAWLWGISAAQGYKYFKTYRQDPLWLKTLVTSVGFCLPGTQYGVLCVPHLICLPLDNILSIAFQPAYDYHGDWNIGEGFINGFRFDTQSTTIVATNLCSLYYHFYGSRLLCSARLDRKRKEEAPCNPNFCLESNTTCIWLIWSTLSDYQRRRKLCFR